MCMFKIDLEKQLALQPCLSSGGRGSLSQDSSRSLTPGTWAPGPLGVGVLSHVYCSTLS